MGSDPTAVGENGRTHSSGCSRSKHQASSDGATNVEWSTSTPGPIVEETDTFCMNTPFDDAGFALLRSVTSAAKFSLSALTSKLTLPMTQWTVPALSAR